VPAFAFSNEPVPDSTPAYEPEVTVNVVPLNVITPVDAPTNVCTATAGDDIITEPSTAKAVEAGINEPSASVNEAPPNTEMDVDASEPVPEMTNPPARTVVAPL
jgi:hypothetical protein